MTSEGTSHDSFNSTVGKLNEVIVQDWKKQSYGPETR